MRHVQRMGQAGDIMIAFGSEKDLRFIFQAFEGVAVNDAISVPLKIRAKFAWSFRSRPALCFRRFLGIG